MKILICLVFICVTALSPYSNACTPVQSHTDAQIKKLLVGSWKLDQVYKGMKVEGLTTYKVDGTFKGTGSITVNGRTMSASIEGKWSVSNGSVQCEIVKTSNPQLIPVGVKSPDKVLSIGKKIYKYRSPTGTSTEKRIN